MAAYCRVSTGREAQLDSLENQKRFFEEYAQRQGYTLAALYADQGVSGRQMNKRPQFLRMLADARAGVFDLLAVKDISRFARNTVDFLSAIRLLKSLGVEVLFLTANQTVLGGSEFILTIFGAIAQEESANLSARVKFGRELGARGGRVPTLLYGYDRQDARTLVPNLAEAAVVEEIFIRYAQEGQSTTAVARVLNSRGVPGKLGGGWSAKTVRRILQNPVYAGQLQNHKYVTVDFLTGRQVRLPEGQFYTHPRPELALVEADLFAAAQRMLTQRARTCSKVGQ